MAEEKETETPVLHVIVVGFHHKKGCQVEYSYPPVIAGAPVDSHQLPEEWKHLPSLALPDGAHNYQKDTVFFHLPSRDAARKTVFCVSCYRQMDAKELINRTADITRSTVQKSVCVISRLPLYGLLKAKLELITHAYFDERDFSKVDLLEQTFKNLNASLKESLSTGTQLFLGLSPRDAVVRFKHKLMVLFKLVLLERRVLFFGSPVETLGSTILTILSLFPGLLEFGLDQAVSDERQCLVSPIMGTTTLDPEDGGTGEEFLEVRYFDVGADSPGEKSELPEPTRHSCSSPMTSFDGEAPESPTIPRDDDLDTDAWRVKAIKEAENRHRKLSGSRGMSADGSLSSPSSVHSNSQFGIHRMNQHGSPETAKCRDLKIHSPHPSLSSQDSTGSGNLSVDLADDSRSVTSHNKKSPLEDVSSLTKISAVQIGHKLTSNQTAVDRYVHEVKMNNTGSEVVGEDPDELTLSVVNSDPLLCRSDSVEELDSPESISKIDREDCFSWEEDRLQLSLAVETDDTSAVEGPVKGQGDSIPSEQDHSEGHLLPSAYDPLSSATPPSMSPAKGSPSSRVKLGKQNNPSRKTSAFKSKFSTAFGKGKPKAEDTGSVEMKPIIKGEVRLHQDDFGFPLAIFTKGCICHPYVSLQLHSVLNDVNVRGFVLGATNILFRQQKQLTDVIIQVDDGKLEVKDRELQKQLQLTTADLRFSELLVRMVTEEKSNMFLDGTEWEGSDEWVRAQFTFYLQSLLATLQAEDGKLLEDFGLPFIAAWRTTHNYRHWVNTLPHPKMADVVAGHPFQGNLSVTDVRMKLNHSMQNTERGRKLNAAVVQTGKYVMQTGRAVGGAFSSARSVVSSWFTSIANDWRHEEEGEEEGGEEKKTADNQSNLLSQDS